MATITMGKVAKGLIKYPIPGKKPPAACSRAAIQARNDPKTSLFAFVCLRNSNWASRISSEIEFKKYNRAPHS